MIMTNKEKDSLTLYCSCGVSDGVLLRTDTFGGLDIALVSDIFYTSQKSRWDIFKEKCKRIWFIIRNKEYSYFDILVEPEDMKEFKEFVNKIEV